MLSWVSIATMEPPIESPTNRTPLGPKASLKDAIQDRWSQPVELFPWLMLLLLLVLAVENLLANRFYRQETGEKVQEAKMQSSSTD